jgi:hypothetical protein
MSGSIRPRCRNSWELRVYAGTDPETGQRRQVTPSGGGSRTQAQRELRRLALANVASERGSPHHPASSSSAGSQPVNPIGAATAVRDPLKIRPIAERCTDRGSGITVSRL